MRVPRYRPVDYRPMPPLHWMPDCLAEDTGLVFVTCPNSHALSIPEVAVKDYQLTESGEWREGGIEAIDCPKCGWGVGSYREPGLELDGFSEAFAELAVQKKEDGLAFDPPENHVYLGVGGDLTRWQRTTHLLRYVRRAGLDNTLDEYRWAICEGLVAGWSRHYAGHHARAMGESLRLSPWWRFYPSVALIFGVELAYYAAIALKSLGLALIGKSAHPTVRRPRD